ncbi:MAG: GYF domain-containing protein [Opitutaceae bacterium]|nr:GYF domain-containing protein [Opitutaceae bacterium]
MATQEFYIRGANDTDARGPFSLEQLTSLAETSGVTKETYFYDATSEQWVTIESNAELMAVLWPEKKKITFKATQTKTLNVEKEGDAPITVEQFLAAAEGKTDDTKDRKNKNVIMMQAAIWGTRAAALICILSAVALALPNIDTISSFDVGKIIAQPYIILGIIDLAIGLLLALGMISLYPLVRFRAVFGLGFLGFLFWTQGQSPAMLAVVATSAGLYFCTILLSYIPLAIAALVGIGGAIAMAGMGLM